MNTTMNTTMNADVTRTDGLRQMLTDRRRRMRADVEERIRDGRTDRSNDVRDIIDICDVGIEEELSFALLQMRTEALARVDAALARLEAGKYGACSACGAEITERRLRALPFAVRCRACEERHEQEQGRDRRDLQRQGHMMLFPELHGA